MTTRERVALAYFGVLQTLHAAFLAVFFLSPDAIWSVLPEAARPSAGIQTAFQINAAVDVLVIALSLVWAVRSWRQDRWIGGLLGGCIDMAVYSALFFAGLAWVSGMVAAAPLLMLAFAVPFGPVFWVWGMRGG